MNPACTRFAPERAEWRAELPAAVKGATRIGIEPDHIPALVRRYVDELVGTQYLSSVTPILSEMRMIKSTQELQLARHAGQVANAMMDAGRAAIGDCVPEYEIAIATCVVASQCSPAFAA